MKLWGGRFEEGPDAAMERFTSSLPFDQRMAAQDVRGSIAHARMLGGAGIIAPEEAEQIVAGLEQIAREIDAGIAIEGAEDIHTWVEQRLIAQIGAVGGKLHTARSRNDQVATDLRLYLREEVDDLDALLHSFQEALLDHAEAHLETVLPGYTHMQHAQPVVLAHHLLAYFWMAERDRDRLVDWRRRSNVLPLGAAALAGSPYPVDREFVARELGFDRVGENSMDNVSDRDFVVELASALALIQVHLSRLAEEIVLWASREFGFLKLGDQVATGSSIMPQKKNPEIAELVRGKTGRVVGNLAALLTMLKGLPLTYDSDLQEDKEGIFDSLDTVASCLGAMTTLLRHSEFDTERMRQATTGDFSTATDLADFLARRGVPFRQAHEVVGRIVLWCEQNERDLESLSADDLQQFSAEFADAPADLTSVEHSVRSRTSAGGTAPAVVRGQLESARSAWTDRGAPDA